MTPCFKKLNDTFRNLKNLLFESYWYLYAPKAPSLQNINAITIIAFGRSKNPKLANPRRILYKVRGLAGIWALASKMGC
jgi:hypothetical protein